MRRFLFPTGFKQMQKEGEARTQGAWAAVDHAKVCSNRRYVLVWNGGVEIQASRSLQEVWECLEACPLNSMSCGLAVC